MKTKFLEINKRNYIVLFTLLFNLQLFAQQWVNVGNADFSNPQAHFPSMAFNPVTGNPYVAYVDNHNLYYPTVMMYNGTSWSSVGGSTVSNHSSSYTSLAIGSLGTTYVAYLDNVSGYVVVMELNGTSWSQLLGPVSTGAVTQISFALDGNDIPYVAYIDATNSSKATVKKFTGS